MSSSSSIAVAGCQTGKDAKSTVIKSIAEIIFFIMPPSVNVFFIIQLLSLSYNSYSIKKPLIAGYFLLEYKKLYTAQ